MIFLLQDIILVKLFWTKHEITRNKSRRHSLNNLVTYHRRALTYLSCSSEDVISNFITGKSDKRQIKTDIYFVDQ